MSEFAEGWYEFVTSVTATTEIAYVHESGDLYVPNSSVLDWEHATRRERLIREDELESALASERAKRERAERAMKAEEQRADVNSDAAVKHDRRALAAEAQVVERDAVIEQAPHAEDCDVVLYPEMNLYPGGDSMCDCWKDRCPSPDALAARDAVCDKTVRAVTHEQIEAFVKAVTPMATNETHAFNLWNHFASDQGPIRDALTTVWAQYPDRADQEEL